jgi:hypothetical protein
MEVLPSRLHNNGRGRVGIGANMAIFSVINTVIFRVPSCPSSDRIENVGRLWWRPEPSDFVGSEQQKPSTSYCSDGAKPVLSECFFFSRSWMTWGVNPFGYSSIALWCRRIRFVALNASMLRSLDNRNFRKLIPL